MMVYDKKQPISRHLQSFLSFLSTAQRYSSSSTTVTSAADSIQEDSRPIVVIDLLPVTLHSTFLSDPRFQSDRFDSISFSYSLDKHFNKLLNH